MHKQTAIQTNSELREKQEVKQPVQMVTLKLEH